MPVFLIVHAKFNYCSRKHRSFNFWFTRNFQIDRMADQIEKYSGNNVLPLDKSSIKEEECEANDFTNNKIHVSNLIIGTSELENYDKMKQYEISNDIKPEFLSCKMEYDNVPNYNVKTEKEIIPDNIKLQFENGLYCEHCQIYYEDYCIKCGMLVHILNKNTDTINGEQVELPDNILEIRNYLGRFGVFALKVIPEGVKLGPFTGFSNEEYLWKSKGEAFVWNKDKTKYLNWMKYINRARSPFEQNLLAFQCNNNLYYQSICQIQMDDELLVHFDDEYEDTINKDLAVNFIPRAEHTIQAVFACTFCCLGFSSISNLRQHKTICFNHLDGRFPDEELTQCTFCKIYLYQQEYLKHHMAYCWENNDRKCVQLTMGNRKMEVTERKKQRCRMYKCAQCKYRTKYKVDFKNHTNQHYKVKMHKCGICNRRFMTKDSLAQHMEYSHVGKEDPEHSASASAEEEHPLPQHQAKQFKCCQCEFRTKYEITIIRHIKTKHLKVFDYKCEFCDYKTNHKTNFEKHIKSKHLKEFDYNCESCQYKTNIKSMFEKHIKSNHLKTFDYKCESCDYKTNKKSHLDMHIKTQHLVEFDHKCDLCEYKTNEKTKLKTHIKSKHLKEFDYKCESCQYKTNRKSYYERHVRSNHLVGFDYKCELCDYKTNDKPIFEKHVKSNHLQCESCDYRTNRKTQLEMHIKSKHLNEFDYKCELCHYKTNRKPLLEMHVKTKHLVKFDYNCEFCRYKTNRRSDFEKHLKLKHVK